MSKLMRFFCEGLGIDLDAQPVAPSDPVEAVPADPPVPDGTIEYLYLLGRLSDGFQSDCGWLYHAVPHGDSKALCGAKPGRRSAGWTYDPQNYGTEATCPRCRAKLAKQRTSDRG